MVTGTRTGAAAHANGDAETEKRLRAVVVNQIGITATVCEQQKC